LIPEILNIIDVIFTFAKVCRMIDTVMMEIRYV